MTPALRLWLIVFLSLTGCSKPPALDPLDADSTILAFGDSLTVGVGARNTESYPTILAELTGLEVINAGVSGETTEQGLARLGSELERYQPDLLILMEGGNDILRNHDPAAIRQNLSAMIQLAAKQSIPVLLMGIPEKKLFSDVAPLYEELAEEHAVIFEGDLVSSLLRNSEYKSDPIHLNGKGYREMAKAIHALLQDTGAIQ